jgi:hypothetical protein
MEVMEETEEKNRAEYVVAHLETLDGKRWTSLHCNQLTPNANSDSLETPGVLGSPMLANPQAGSVTTASNDMRC